MNKSRHGDETYVGSYVSHRVSIIFEPLLHLVRRSYEYLFCSIGVRLEKPLASKIIHVAIQKLSVVMGYL